MFANWKVALPAVTSLVGVLAHAGDTQPKPGLDPRGVPGGGQAWTVAPATGALSLQLALGVVPGEVPIVLRMHYSGSCSWIENGLGENKLNPIRARVVFDAPFEDPNVASADRGVDVQEAVGSSRSYVAFKPQDGQPLRVASRFGFPAVSWSEVKTHRSGKYISYTIAQDKAVGSIPGDWVGRLTTPTGFHSVEPEYLVLMGSDRAHLYQRVRVGDSEMVLPMLWVDRFKHHVAFSWSVERKDEGTRVLNVLAVNQRGLGVQARWLLDTATAAAGESVLFRADFIGFRAPSIQISGLPGAAQGSSQGDGLFGTAGTPSFRPTRVDLKEGSDLKAPAWAEGSLPALPEGDDTQSAPGVAWEFSYTGQQDELESFRDPAGVETTFSYVTKWFFGGAPCKTWFQRMVTSARSVDAKTGAEYQSKWEYRIPEFRTEVRDGRCAAFWTSTDWVTTLRQGYVAGDPADVPSVEYTFAGPLEDVAQYRNAAISKYRVFTPGKTWIKNTYRYWWNKGGLDGSLSLPYSAWYLTDGEPGKVIFMEWDDTGSALCSQDICSYSGNANAVGYQEIRGLFLWESYSAKFGGGMGSLEPGRLETVTIRRRKKSIKFPEYLVPEIPFTKSYSAQRSLDTETVRTQRLEYAESSGLLSAEKVDRDGMNIAHRTFGHDQEGRVRETCDLACVGGAPGSDPFQRTACERSDDGLSLRVVTTAKGSPGLESAMTFDRMGRVLSTRDENGQVTTREYDIRGRLRSVSTAGAGREDYSYPSELEMNWTNTDGRSGSESRDGFGRLLRRTRPDGVMETYAYDQAGRRTALHERNADGVTRSSVWKYDPLGRIVFAKNWSDPRSQKLGYEGLGTSFQSVTATFSDGRKEIADFDPLGRLVTESKSFLYTQRTYDPAGRPLKITHGVTALSRPDGANGMGEPRLIACGPAYETENEYDGAGNLVARRDVSGKTEFREFDETGMPQLAVRNGTLTQRSEYDGFRRLCFLKAGAEWARYVYAGSNLREVQTGSGEFESKVTYVRDKHGRLDQEHHVQAGQSYAISYAYDSSGRVAALTYPSGRVVRYAYDTKGRVQAVEVDGHPIASVSYDSWGHRAHLQFASGASSEWTWTEDGSRPVKLAIRDKRGTVWEMPYEYDVNGNLTRGAGWDRLIHSPEGYLLSARGFGVTNRLEFDGGGNSRGSFSTGDTRGQWNNFSWNTRRTCAGGDRGDFRTPAMLSNGAWSGWEFGNHGVVEALATHAGARERLAFLWDGLGRLSRVRCSAQGLDKVYDYGPTGLRIRTWDRETPEKSRAYAYDSQGVLLCEFALTPQFQCLREIIYIGKDAIAEVDAQGIHELHSDHLGTPRVITCQETGEVEGRQSFGPFGESMGIPEHTYGYSPLTGFTGHLRTEDSGLIYMRSRFYAPMWHSFLSPDPVTDGNAPGPYAYANAKPFERVDPTGTLSFRSIGRDIGNLWEDIKRPFLIAVASYMAGRMASRYAYGDVRVGFGSPNGQPYYVGTVPAKQIAFGAVASGVASGIQGRSIQSALSGLSSGAMLSGIGGLGASRGWGSGMTLGAKAVAAGGVTEAYHGGFMLGFKHELAYGAASVIYTSMVGKAATLAPGVNMPADGSGNIYRFTQNRKVPRDFWNNNVIGLNGEGNFWVQGGPVSRVLNLVPGMNSVALFHDNMLGSVTKAEFAIFNVPTMPFAAIINYAAILDEVGEGCR